MSAEKYEDKRGELHGRQENRPRISPEVAEMDARYVIPTYTRQGLEVVSGSGTEVVGRDGRSYLDFVTGLSVSNFGHCHPAVVEAVREQAGKLIHCSNLFYTEPQARLAERLSKIAGGGQVFFGNSGAEANEAAIKIARKRGRELGGGTILSLEESFHGRTMATLSATGQPGKLASFGPPLEVFAHIPIGDTNALREAFNAGRISAFMAEPVAGESGVRIVPPEFLQEAQRLCHRFDALFVVDEVQTGLGRCGAAFAYQRYGLEPDIVTVAKSLAGGLPMGAVIARHRAQGVFGPGDHGSTFGGGPVAAAAALAVLDLLEEEGLFSRVEERGAQLQGWLDELVEAGAVSSVRRLGLMVAVDLVEPTAHEVVSAARESGILLNATGESTLRFLPPLTVSPAEVDRVGRYVMETLTSGGNE